MYVLAHKNIHAKPCVFTAPRAHCVHADSHKLKLPDIHASKVQRSCEGLNGVLLLDALGEDIPEGGRNIPEGSLAVSLGLRIPRPGNINTSVLTDTALRTNYNQC